MSSITKEPEFEPGRAGRVSIRDVARLAGVSQGTVSNTLNHPERVSPAKRAAVEAAIERLGFIRHEGARHLRAGQSSTLGLLLLDAWNPGFMEVARGVEDSTAQRGWTLLISNSARDIEREKAYLRLYAESRVAGVIVVPHDHFATGLHQIRTGGIPVVVLDRVDPGDQGLSVGVDDVAGGRLVATHLIELGHRHVVFAGDETAATPVHDRLEGMRRAVSATDGAVRLDVSRTALTVEGGLAVGEQLAATPAAQRPTAVLAAIDLVAFGILQALLQNGIRVPEDISLAGYDDIPFARQLSVPLTTVNRSHYEMGTAAAELLNATLTGVTLRPRHVMFRPKLVIRESTAAPRP
ncbi:MAG: LacI family transcriptional regulator [Pseudonocardiales bacterium]|nr:LacI family transcriptional regulator [Pseudonocardiales bacterium]